MLYFILMKRTVIVLLVVKQLLRCLITTVMNIHMMVFSITKSVTILLR